MDKFSEDRPNPWKTLEKKAVYDNPWIYIEEHQVINPGGGDGIYGVVHFKNLAIGIIPVDEDWNTWLVGQYRYPLNTYAWEIPEGGGPVGIDPLESAKRELQEETGLSAGRWDVLLETYLSNSTTDERGIIYLARELEMGTANPTEDEQLEIAKVPLEQAFELVRKGQIMDSLSVMGLQHLEMAMLKGAIER